MDTSKTQLVWVGSTKKFLTIKPKDKIKIKFDLLIFKNGLNNVTKFQNNSCTIEVYLKQTTTNTYSMIKKLNNMLRFFRISEPLTNTIKFRKANSVVKTNACQQWRES